MSRFLGVNDSLGLFLLNARERLSSLEPALSLISLVSICCIKLNEINAIDRLSVRAELVLVS